MALGEVDFSLKRSKALTAKGAKKFREGREEELAAVEGVAGLWLNTRHFCHSCV
jgi:hypothetical protein